MKRTNQSGFTLIELMISVAIIGIIIGIAVPSYQKHIIRTSRSDAQSQMMDIANLQEQFLLANRSYASKATLEVSSYKLPDKVSAKYTYSITLGTGSVPSYLITFTPYGNQASDGVLTLSNDGAKTPTSKW